MNCGGFVRVKPIDSSYKRVIEVSARYVIEKIFDGANTKLFKHPGKKRTDFGKGGNAIT